MKIIIEPKREDWVQILKRPTKTYEDLEGLVKEIFADIQKNGNQALKYLSICL